MNISRNIYEGKPSHFLIATAQKIAIYLIVPLALVVFFEAIVKNMIVFNLANFCIAIINGVHGTITPEKKAEHPIENQQAPHQANVEVVVINPAPPILEVSLPPLAPPPVKTSYFPSWAKTAKIGLLVFSTCLTGYGVYSTWNFGLTT